MDMQLKAVNLSKSYKDIKAVSDVSFDVRRGSLFAFLGQNGAGKSTTIKMITTLLRKDQGEVLLDESNNENYMRSKIGVVFQENVLDDLLTVKENLILRGSLYFNNKQKVNEKYNEIINKLDLLDVENQKFKTLSGGQKRRCEIARALLSEPEMLILDEPTTGLDPEARVKVWNILGLLRKEWGITIFLTTHYMEEASNADYIVIINKGKIITEGTPSELKVKYSKDYFKVVPKKKDELVEYLNQNKRLFKKVADQYHVEIKSSQEAIELLIEIKDNIKSFEVVKGTLDDVFVNVIGEENA